MLKLSQLHTNAKKQSSVFGTSSKSLNEETLLFIEETINDIDNQEFKKEALEEIEKEKTIDQLKSRIKEL